MKELVYSVITQDELLGQILDAVDCIRNSQWKLFQPTRTVHKRAAAVLRLAVAFLKTSFKQRAVQIKGNFMKLTLHLYFKCIMYYVGLLFCYVYCQ